MRELKSGGRLLKGTRGKSDRNSRIWAVVRRIPRGRVATYGQIARLAGLPGHARQVGYALHDLPSGSRVPWHRVINAQGRISRRADGSAGIDQRMLLLNEGVWFDARGKVDLEQFGWHPRSVIDAR
ncbi:MAG TPA: MGMT family protein [Gemmatimonadaceae bacterium]|nr:MGMT family protein [Gemmatimonadaceae bacterium]